MNSTTAGIDAAATRWLDTLPDARQHPVRLVRGSAALIAGSEVAAALVSSALIACPGLLELGMFGRAFLSIARA